MDTIEFRLGEEEFPTGDTLAIIPIVNGVHLRELAGQAEKPFAKADRTPDLAGRYAGLVADSRVRWPSQHFLGRPEVTWFGDGDTVLLGCTCGDAGCWPLTADVVVGRSDVVWHHFRTGHRPWDLGRLGPFRFDLNLYTAALRRAASV